MQKIVEKIHNSISESSLATSHFDNDFRWPRKRISRQNYFMLIYVLLFKI